MATLSVDDYKFHKGPGMYVTTSLNVTRSSASDSRVSISGRVYFRLIYYPSDPAYYGTPPYTGAHRGLSVYLTTDQDSTGNIGSFYGMSHGDGDYNYKEGNSIYVDTSIEFTSGNLLLYIDCEWMSNGECNKGCSHVHVGSLNIDQVPYNPYTPPTAPTYCNLNKNSLKPDQSIQVSWGGETGGTPGINHFQVEMSQWRGGSQIRNYTRVSGPIYYSTHGYNPCIWSGTLNNLYDYDSGTWIQIRPRRYFTISCCLLHWKWL